MKHSISLDGRQLSYGLRPSRRGISIVVSPEEGLLLRAPRGTSIRLLEQTLRENAPWVFSQLDKLSSRGLPLPPRGFNNGELLPCMGEQLCLQTMPGLGQRGRLHQRPGQLLMQIPFELAGEERRAFIIRMLSNWYRQQAWQHLPPRLRHFCQLLALPFVPGLKISSARSRWGSCDSKRVVHLSWRLMMLPPELSDYVVAHEVCHLRHMNHSGDFWALLNSIMPDAKSRRACLDREGPLYRLD